MGLGSAEKRPPTPGNAQRTRGPTSDPTHCSLAPIYLDSPAALPQCSEKGPKRPGLDLLVRLLWVPPLCFLRLLCIFLLSLLWSSSPSCLLVLFQQSAVGVVSPFKRNYNASPVRLYHFFALLPLASSPYPTAVLLQVTNSPLWPNLVTFHNFCCLLEAAVVDSTFRTNKVARDFHTCLVES